MRPRFLAAALAYGAVTGLSLLGDAALMRRDLTTELVTALALFAAGATVAAALAWPIADRVARRRAPATRLAAMLALLMVGTAGFSAFFFFLWVRAYYARFYPAELTLTWLHHVAYTGAAAAYQVGVLGLRFFLPFGLIPLFAASFIFAARPGRRL